MTASKISIDNAKKEKLFYFVANAVVVRREDMRCLILKRDDREVAHPGKWATPGGKLEWADFAIDKPTRVNGNVLDFEGAIEDLLVREVREEAGVEVGDDFRYINSAAFVRPDETPVVMVKLAVPYKSGEVKVQEGDFTDFAWVSAEEARGYDCIQGVPEEIEKAVTLFKDYSR